MKRVLALILAFLMLVSVFVSCGILESIETQIPIEKKTEKQTEIVGFDNLNDNNNGENNNNNNGENNNNNGGNIGGEDNEIYTRNGNKITFGSYPQTEVTDIALIETLTAMSGTLPTSSKIGRAHV